MGFFTRHQEDFDTSRDVYQIIAFPNPLPEDRVGSWLRSIGTTLKGSGRYWGVPTLVFEVVASGQGIHHLVRLPKGRHEYLLKQLRTSIPGAEYVKVTDDSAYRFSYGVELSMHNRARALPVANVTDFANRVLGSMQDAVEEGDELVLQWVVTHANPKPIRGDAVASTNVSLWGVLTGNTAASPQEIADRKAKQSDQLFYAVGRIGARSKNPVRAQRLVADVVAALTSETGAAYFKAKPLPADKISHDMEFAKTPLLMNAELSTTELMSVVAWPLGSPNVPGLFKSAVRHLPVPNSVLTSGIQIGVSTMPGNERPIALGDKALVTHTYVGGSSGVGKSTLMTHVYRQAVNKGHGAIIIEYDGNLIDSALRHTPKHRLSDLIVVNIARSNRPVGLNILKLAEPTVIAGQLSTLLEALYPDSKSIYTEKLIAHIVPALAVVPNATIADIPIVANPTGPVEKAWVKWIIDQQTDPRIKRFLEDWHSSANDKDRVRNVQPLDNRLWKLLTPLESRNMISQETSSFDPIDVIQNNRILLVNLAGVPEEVASLIGSFIVSGAWRAARTVQAEKANLMFLDEFQYFSRLNGDFEDMLAVARRRNLGLLLATQYVERLPMTTQDAIAANARTKVIFQSSPKSASRHREDFGDQSITKEQFQNLPAYTAIARINTPTGMSSPITLKTLPEPTEYGLRDEAIRLSDARYGREVEQIYTAETLRRRAPQAPRTSRTAMNDDPFRQKIDPDERSA